MPRVYDWLTGELVMKPDEYKLLTTLAAMQGTNRLRPRDNDQHVFATTIGHELGIHPKRVCYLLEKWADKGWWECGVSLRTGWLTAKGLEVANRISIA